MTKSVARVFVKMLLAVVACDALAQVYRWTDEKGQVHFGDEAPSPSAQRVTVEQGPATDTNSSGGLRPGEKAWLADIEARARREQQAGSELTIPGTETLVPRATPSRGLPFSEFRKIQTGMSEAQVLFIGGSPDTETIDAVNTAGVLLKSYYYTATGYNKHITRIQFLNGNVVRIERDLNPSQ
jgi:hypothetical protein